MDIWLLWSVINNFIYKGTQRERERERERKKKGGKVGKPSHGKLRDRYASTQACNVPLQMKAKKHGHLDALLHRDLHTQPTSSLTGLFRGHPCTLTVRNKTNLWHQYTRQQLPILHSTNIVRPGGRFIIEV